MEEAPIYDQLTKDALYLIAVEMDMPDLIAFCLSDKTVNRRICDDNRFWLFKLRHDFDFDEIINKEMAKEYYKFLHKNRDKTLDEQLIEAIKEGNLVIVRYLLDVGADIHANDDKALLSASQYGHLDIVRYLIRLGANIHARNNGPLILASQGGHLDIVKYLIGEGANIHAQDGEVLMAASRYGHLNIVKYLLDLDNRWNLTSALAWAAMEGHLDIVIYLVEKGAEYSEGWGDWPLPLAAREGHLDIVKYLVENGDLNSPGLKAAIREALGQANAFYPDGYNRIIEYLERFL